MSNFFVNVQDGRVAVRRQLVEAGMADEYGRPVRPWHEIQGTKDASTLWYAVMRKRERGIFIGALCLRHSSRQTSMEARGWEEVPVRAIGPEGAPAEGEGGGAVAESEGAESEEASARAEGEGAGAGAEDGDGGGAPGAGTSAGGASQPPR